MSGDPVPHCVPYRTAEDILQDARLTDLDQRIKYLTHRVRELFDLETRIIAIEHVVAPLKRLAEKGGELERKADELLRSVTKFHDPMAKFD